AEYATFLEDNPRELGTLAKEMLIGVTRFFRDQHVFDLLEKDVIPHLLQQTPPDDAIRVWVPACATGEEAYSIAILFAEAAGRLRRPVDVKIFATDLDRDAITFASAGVYAEGIAAELTPERLGRWFVRRGDEYHVARSLRQMVLFAHHNAFKDPPFTRLDLVSCRNLLIYMEPVLQRKLLNLFHYALKPERWLLLGTSETTGDLPDRFRVSDARAKLYVSIPGPRSLINEAQPRAPRGPGARSWQLEYRGQATDEAIAIEFVHKAVSAEFLPLCLLINENNELVHVMGNAGGFLSIQAGVATLDVLSLLPKSLSTVLGAGLLRVAREGTEVVYAHLPAPSWENAGRRVTLRIRPVVQPRSDRRFTLLVVTEEPGTTPAEVSDVGAERRVNDLERELVLAKENLQATIEELQTANEELQATNEELISSNEELQSTNEELQAVNEELNTVNSEHEVKIGTLVQLTDDMDNLLVSTGIGALFLDHELLIRKFTPAVKQQVNVLERDIGRPVEHLSFNFRDAELLADLRRTLTTGGTLERPVVTRGGESYLMRVLPYVARGGERVGVVLTFSEVTALKDAQEAHAAVLDALPDPVALVSNRGILDHVNAAFCAGWHGEPPTGRSYAEVVGEALALEGEEAARLAAGVGRVVNGTAPRYVGVHPTANGPVRVHAVPSAHGGRAIVVVHTRLGGEESRVG
ncbi:MAG: CheR family methyltransferase, partial [Myxococcota bacterium]